MHFFPIAHIALGVAPLGVNFPRQGWRLRRIMWGKKNSIQLAKSQCKDYANVL
jgi:hypothetical protein